MTEKSKLLEVFHQVIIAYVEPLHVLDHVKTWLTNSAYEEILRKNTSFAEGTTLLLNKLKENNEPGWAEGFLQALRVNNYEYLFRLINDLETQPHREEFEYILTLWRPDFAECLQVVELIPQCKKYKILNKRDEEEIRAEHQNYGPSAAAAKFLNKLPRHSDNFFPEFLFILKENGKYDDILCSIDPKLTNCEDLEEMEKMCNKLIQEQREISMHEMDLHETGLVPNVREPAKMEEPSEVIGAVCGPPDSMTSLEALPVYPTKTDTKIQTRVDLSELFIPLASQPQQGTNGEGAATQQEVNNIHPVTPNQAAPPIDNLTGTAARVYESATRALARNASASNNETLISETAVKEAVNTPEDANEDTAIKQVMANADVTAMKQMMENVADDDTAIKPMMELGEASGSEQLPNENMLDYQDPKSVNLREDLVMNDLNLDETIPKTAGSVASATDLKVPVAEEQQVSETESVSDEENEEPENSADQAIALRSYQKELLQPALQGKNAIVVAPTGSGKTLVAIKAAEHHLDVMKEKNEEVHVLFIVPNVALVEQQLQQFQTTLAQREFTYKGISGDHQASKKVSFDILYKRFDVLVLTPQILLDALESDDSDLTLNVFTMLIFDECHHTTKDHPYNKIMSYYIDEKLSKKDGPKPLLPQVIGLTASVGVGKGGKLKDAQDHILKLCANLDAEVIQTVSKEISELHFYQKLPQEKVQLAQKPKNDPFTKQLESLMQKIEQQMIIITAKVYKDVKEVDLKKLVCAPNDQGSQRYTQWVSRLRREIPKITDKEIHRQLYALAKELKMYNTAMLLNADCRTTDALQYLKRSWKEKSHEHKTDTNQYLDEIYSDGMRKLERISDSEVQNNPKLEAVKNYILNYKLKENEDMRVIVFCKTREMTIALQDWMKDDRELKSLNPERLVSSNAAHDKGGLTKSAQEDALQYFKNGVHKIIIATTVAEEGLDIEKCNLVIRYEHVTNETARIQAKGRARVQHGLYVTIGSQSTVDKDDLNKMREELMQKAMKKISEMDQPEFAKKIKDFQREAKIERQMKKVGRQHKRKHKLQQPKYEFDLLCKECAEFSCCSKDLRHIKSSHHVISDETFHERIRLVPYPNQETLVDSLPAQAKIHCRKCNAEWGFQAQYHSVPVFLMKCDSLVFSEKTSTTRRTYERWKEVPFTVTELQSDELEKMGESSNQQS